MKSFAKTFRTFLAMSLVLCMVMSCVTVSADEVPTVALAVTQLDEVPDTDGYYSVTATVSEATNGGSATILAYTGEAPTNATIGYANQDVLVDNTKTFNMELKKGTYTVLAGATGFAKADLETLVINGVAPTFNVATLNVATNLTDETAVKDEIVVENFPEATDGDKEEVTYSIGGTDADKFAISGSNIVIAADSLAANEAGYNFTLVATAGGETAELAGNLKVASTTIYVKPAVITATSDASYGADKAAAEALLPTEVALLLENGTDTGLKVGVTYTFKEYANNVYTFNAEFGALSEKYDWISGTDVNVTATVNVVDNRTVVTLNEVANQTIGYGETAKVVTIADYTDVAGAKLESETWETSKDGVVTTYTNTVVLPELTHKFADGSYKKEVSYTVTYNETRKTITSITLNKTKIEIGYKGTPNFSDIVAIADTGDELEFASENWTGSIDATQDGATAEYTNSVVVPEDKYIYKGFTEVKVTVTVTDDRQVVTGITIVNEDIEVAYNTAAIDFSKVTATYTVDKGEAPKVAIGEFACGTYDPAVPGEYEFTAAITNEDNDVYKINADVAKEITVKVIVASNVYVAPVGETSTLSDGDEYTVTEYGTPVDAVLASGAGTVLNITGGRYDGGNTKLGTDGNTAVWATDGAVVNISGGKFTIGGLADGDTGHIDMIYASKGGKIYITDGTFDATGAYVWAANAKDQDGSIVEITGGTFIGWNPADPGFVLKTADGEASGYVDQPAYVPETHTVKLVEDTNNTWEVVEKKYVVSTIEYLDADKKVIDISETIEVKTGTPWDSALDDYLPYYVKLTAETGETAEISTTSKTGSWFERVNGEDKDVDTENFPPAVGALKYYGFKLTELPAYWSIAEGTTFPVVTVKTEGTPSADEFVVIADGYNKKYVASRIGAESVITVEPAVEGGTIAGAKAYAFEISDGTNTTKVDFSESNTTTIAVPATLETNGTRYTVTATVQYEDGSELSKTIYVTKYTSVFSGSVYINDTYGELDYSAVRSNRNRPITVSYKFVNVNDADYAFDGTAVVNVYHVDDLETAIATYTFDKNATSYEISVDEIAKFAAKDGEYKFYVTYTDEAGVESAVGSFTSRKGTYISNNGTWYSDFTINDMTRSGITIRRNETLKNEFTLTDLGADGKAYIGYSLIGYNVDFEDIEAGEYAETTKTENTHEYNLAEDFANAANASYKFYSLAKLDSADQDYFDMKVSRVVYVYGNKTNISNFRFGVDGAQGATAGPKAEDGYITIAPYWYQEFSKDTYKYNDPISYKLIFESGVDEDALAAEGAVVGGTVDGKTVSFADTKVGYNGTTGIGSVKISANVFERKVEAKLEVYVDDVLDRTVNKTFWPQAQ